MDPPRQDKTPPSPAKMLDAMLRELLTAEPDDAKALLEPLGLFASEEIERRLEKAYDAATEPRAKKRAVWAAGELGGLESLRFLLSATLSESADVRRIAAAALAKAGALAVGSQRLSVGLLPRVRDALGKLSADPAAPVAQAARRAIETLDRR
jgi:hypothetical protein